MSGTVYVWGDNSEFQLGGGAPMRSSTPIALGTSNMKRLPQFVRCAWAAEFGVAPHGRPPPFADEAPCLIEPCKARAAFVCRGPVLGCAPPPPSCRAACVVVSCGFFHTLLKDEGGQLWCWGDNRRSQCGAGANAPSHIKSPMLVEGLPRISKFVAGGYHSIAMHCAFTARRPPTSGSVCFKHAAKARTGPSLD